jgi:hypothetical protein
MRFMSKGLLVVLLSIITTYAQAEDWSFEFEPYMLMSSIEGDNTIGRASPVDVAVNFGDILEVLDVGLMGHFEAQHTSGWGLALDYGFMDLRQDGVGPRGGIAGLRIRQGVFEALVTKRHERGDGYVDYFGGLRWWDNDISLSLDAVMFPGSTFLDINEDWIDLVIGARMMRPISDKWQFDMRGDIGGFGVQADFTSAVSLGFRYNISDLMDLHLQYKAQWVDYENGTPGQIGYYAYDTVTHGPILGLAFKF